MCVYSEDVKEHIKPPPLSLLLYLALGTSHLLFFNRMVYEKYQRHSKTAEQQEVLLRAFAENTRPTDNDFTALATLTGLHWFAVRRWFRNERYKRSTGCCTRIKKKRAPKTVVLAKPRPRRMPLPPPVLAPIPVPVLMFFQLERNRWPELEPRPCLSLPHTNMETDDLQGTLFYRDTFQESSFIRSSSS